MVATGVTKCQESQGLDARLFRDLATLRTDADVFACVAELEWQGPTAAFPALCGKLGVPDLAERAERLARR